MECNEAINITCGLGAFCTQGVCKCAQGYYQSVDFINEIDMITCVNEAGVITIMALLACSLICLIFVLGFVACKVSTSDLLRLFMPFPVFALVLLIGCVMKMTDPEGLQVGDDLIFTLLASTSFPLASVPGYIANFVITFNHNMEFSELNVDETFLLTVFMVLPLISLFAMFFLFLTSVVTDDSVADNLVTVSFSLMAMDTCLLISYSFELDKKIRNNVKQLALNRESTFKQTRTIKSIRIVTTMLFFCGALSKHLVRYWIYFFGINGIMATFGNIFVFLALKRTLENSNAFENRKETKLSHSLF